MRKDFEENLHRPTESQSQSQRRLYGAENLEQHKVAAAQEEGDDVDS